MNQEEFDAWEDAREGECGDGGIVEQEVVEQISEIDKAIRDSSSKGEVMDLIQCKEVLKDELEELR